MVYNIHMWLLEYIHNIETIKMLIIVLVKLWVGVSYQTFSCTMYMLPHWSDIDNIPDGKCKIEDVAEGDSVCLGLLNPDNCFIVDVVKHVFVWVGGRASQKEKKNGLGYAHNYLKGKVTTLTKISTK